ncbi:dimethyl sulfoxide reductase anchor subunit family protein [Neotabrizicola shimadae]|uniref:Dimethyl sulfoxide reductase anchor subunit n=1 Tax=Neotabrizicola shimadae TaxID=2807096 RepID=A0A8G0ZWL5_9RHOB|nr:DmsC/YnfH family molybdoenzyme membrane anchor subunit [Neotabrizicola shimadae]QYZ70206.1 dimethyl sulfoxide reductase anchor subunit [Neotabrizicola shimadae]
MHPAPSVILFTVFSGMGFGFLALLGLGVLTASGWTAFFLWGLGYALAVGGLVASTFHLGHPERAFRAFSQWQTSWLSREGVASVATLLVLAPVAAGQWLGLPAPQGLGWIGAAGCAATVFCTSMIYAQLKTVPRWHHWITPVLFLAFALTGGLILAGQMLAMPAALALSAILFLSFRIGDGQFPAAALTTGHATGLAHLGRVTVLERGHTAGNYLLTEMIHVVGRKHAEKLRIIAILLAGILPALVLLVLPLVAAIPLATAIHLIGAMAARWLFFAEAEHVVGLYYGMR